MDRNRQEDAGLGFARNERDWCSRIEAGPDELFIKLIDGTWGINAFGAKRQDSGQWDYCGNAGSAEDLYAFAMRRLGDSRGWLVQQRVRPHRELQKIMSANGLGTVRVVTVMHKGMLGLKFAVLRIPVGDNRVDNFFHGTSGNFVAAVDITTGRIDKARASESRSWPSIVDADEHPETGIKIAGLVVPFWTELKDLVVRAHLSLPGLVTLGWDVAVTNDGPLLVEANGIYDVDLVQVALRRGIKTDFKDFLDAHYF